MHVLSPDRQTLYTLYTNQPEHLHSRDLAAGLTQSSGEVYAFVHVLNLTEGWAYCLDLPQPFGEGPAGAHALALSSDGQQLYITDRSSGKVALADTNQLIVRRVADVGADPHPDRASAATQIGLSGSLFLSSASELVVVDPGTL
jgi:DNA-binding beta-propeller fold protein YncE